MRVDIMAEQIADGSELVNANCNTNLPEVVASMQMLTVNNEVPECESRRYSMRKRVPKASITTEVRNRRFNMKPKKRSYSTMENDDEIREYYLDKSLKNKTTSTLETIYEEIDGMSENSTVINGRKLRRLIQFNAKDVKMSDAKTRKRKAKVKRSFGSKIRMKANSISMPAFLKKLNGIMMTDPPSTPKS